MPVNLNQLSKYKNTQRVTNCCRNSSLSEILLCLVNRKLSSEGIYRFYSTFPNNFDGNGKSRKIKNRWKFKGSLLIFFTVFCKDKGVAVFQTYYTFRENIIFYFIYWIILVMFNVLTILIFI